TMLLPALPDIINEFNISYGTAAWIFSAYLIVAAVMTPVAGRLSDLYGKKKILLIMLGTYIVGLAMGGFADNILLLLVSRVIQGVGLAAIPADFSILTDNSPPAKLAIEVGLFGSAYSAGSVVGLFVGASIIQSFGWHATFLAIVPFTALVTLLIIRFVTESAILEDGSALKDIKHSESNTNRKSLTIDLKGVLSLSATISFFLQIGRAHV